MSKRADIRAYVGGTGTGKTTEMMAELKRRSPRRLLVWDAEHEFDHLGVPTSEWRQVIELSKLEQFAIVFHPPLDRAKAEPLFSLFCKIAFVRSSDSRPVCVMADELADVVHSNWAPEGWNMLVRRGRKRGIVILAASQRPAEIDKTFWSLATFVRCTSLNSHDDQLTMARAINVPIEEVRALTGYQFIDRDKNANFRTIERTQKP